ncbi:Phospholipase/carboxylesterase [Artomyces pyxidatus]|uniref:Phospholipase/carboxylesterase n=1 Tax=Artomyces pyxidatus TaxID=48021 RepID=A0ACB8TCT6_9AGAM|nr:Phospholipase/carboxylesterase [Artomyces pyxidatus]
MSISAPKLVIVPPTTEHTATVIFIHGLGDTGHGWKPVANMFQADPELSHVKWVLPHAPTLSITANMGMEMPGWFDILSFGFDAEEDEQGMLRSVSSINKLVTDEVDSGIASDRIVVGGFSQGGVMSLLLGLTSERKLAGIACLSGWIALRHKLRAMASPQATTLPIFWGHGVEDPLVKYRLGVESATFLKEQLSIKETTFDSPDLQGLAFNSYNGVGHSTNQKELDDLKRWLEKVLPKGT